jgi:hypothetical protein
MVGLRRDYPNAVWVHGNCPRGFDKQVKNCATRWLIEQDVYPAKWKEFGRAAGMMRNADIIRDADLLVACWDGREEGGTWGHNSTGQDQDRWNQDHLRRGHKPACHRDISSLKT